jgi:hypothetical protein
VHEEQERPLVDHGEDGRLGHDQLSTQPGEEEVTRDPSRVDRWYAIRDSNPEPAD